MVVAPIRLQAWEPPNAQSAALKKQKKKKWIEKQQEEQRDKGKNYTLRVFQKIDKMTNREREPKIDIEKEWVLKYEFMIRLWPW